MIQELEKYNGTILVWSAMGGGKSVVYGRLAENTNLADQLAKLSGAEFVPLVKTPTDGMQAFVQAFQRVYAPLCPYPYEDG